MIEWMSIIHTIRSQYTPESWTSQTCTLCGYMQKALSTRLYAKCNCVNLFECDINGATNIVLHAIAEWIPIEAIPLDMQMFVVYAQQAMQM